MALQLTFNVASGSGNIVLPLTYSGTLTVDWGDGNIDNLNSHTYSYGTYNVSITTTGSITVFGNDNGSTWTGNNYLTAVISFGTVGLTSLKWAFAGCNNLVSVSSTLPSSITNLYGTFSGASSLNDSNLTLWDVSNVTTMNRLFNSCSSFNQPLNSWNVLNVTDMVALFSQAFSFNQPIYLWNTSSVTNMSSMFDGAFSFNSPFDVIGKNFNTSNVLDMSFMFREAYVFNQDIGYWNTSKVTNMSFMFRESESFNNNNSSSINNWNVSNVQNMFGMFLNALSFNQPLNLWNVSNVTNFNGFLSGNTVLSIENLNALFNGWATRPVNPNIVFSANGLTYNRYAYNSVQILQNPPNNWTINATYDPTCFLEGTKICCYVNNIELYFPIEQIRKGMLVKTFKSGYKPVTNIGKSILFNPGNDKRIKARLYKCSKSNFSELFEDLYITGCHSILVDGIPEESIEDTVNMMGKIYGTEFKYRFPACLDKRTEPYQKEGQFKIWHIALENENYYGNYGIYANGLLVESCSNRYITEVSGMELK